MDRRQFLKLAGGTALGPAVSRFAGNGAGSVLASGPAALAHQSTARPNYGPDPAPGTGPAPVTRKLMVLTLNPRLPSKGNVRAHQFFGYNDPDLLIANHIRDLRHASFGYANYVVAENILIDDFARWPATDNGIRYDEQRYLDEWAFLNQHRRVNTDIGPINYYALLDEFNIFERVRSGQIDEVWSITTPFGGVKWEAVMAGPGASNSNGPPLGGTDHAGRRFVIMAYNYERSLTEMLHSYGHRAEGHLSHAHRNVPEHDNLWRRFLRREHVTPGIAEVGNVHFPPNAVRDYDYSNPGAVQCNADDWYHYPYLNNERFRAMSSSEWSSDGRQFFLWWFRHMPHLAGDCDGIAHNWWRYIVDPNTY